MNLIVNRGLGGRLVGTLERASWAGLGWASLVLGLSASSCQGGEVDTKGPGDCAEGPCERTGQGEAFRAPGPDDDASSQGSDGGNGASPDVLGSSLRVQDTCPEGSTFDPVTGTCNRIPICPAGSPKCDPEMNGRGLYAADEEGHCFRNDDGQALFCPEGFVNTPAGVRLRLRLRGARDASFVYEAPVKAWRVDGDGVGREVALRRLGAERSKLAITYGEGPRFETDKVASGAALAALRLEFSVEAPAEAGGPRAYAYALKLEAHEEGATGGWLGRYRVFYQQQGAVGAVWRPHCASGGAQVPASFLGGTSVDGQSGRASDAPNVTTMSCQAGAVDACVAWGYAPSADPKAGGAAERGDLFAACLHAKRATYLAGSGDPTSYTQNGTRITRGDTLGVNPFPTERLEALWGPNGAICVNRENLRRPELRDAVPNVLPPCAIADASATALLATGLPPDAL